MYPQTGVRDTLCERVNSCFVYVRDTKMHVYLEEQYLCMSSDGENLCSLPMTYTSVTWIMVEYLHIYTS